MEIGFREFEAGDEAAFRRLNEAWITAYFSIEAPDVAILGDPRGRILEQGGCILMAVSGGRAVGCCALLPVDEGCFELGKMAVAEEVRGRGIGRGLLEFAIAHARSLGAAQIYLETNRKLQSALHLYRAAGFRQIPESQRHPSPYSRSDVAMELTLR